jgi:hypothetical protein
MNIRTHSSYTLIYLCLLLKKYYFRLKVNERYKYIKILRKSVRKVLNN